MSTLGPVKAALLTLWQATFNPDQVVVQYGPRVGLATAGGRLRIGNARGTSVPEAAGPKRPMQEEYDVECVLSYTVNGGSDGQQLVTEQVLAWFDVAEYAVRASPSQSLGVAGVNWAVVSGDWALVEAPAEETTGPINSALTFNVHVRALYRLT